MLATRKWVMNILAYTIPKILEKAISSGTIDSLVKQVESLPEENIDENLIYLVPSDNPETSNLFIEYMYINFYTKDEIDNLLNNINNNINSLSDNINNLDNNINSLSNSINNINSDINSLSTSTSELNSQFNLINSSVSDNTNNINSLSQSQSELSSNIAEISSEVNNKQE